MSFSLTYISPEPTSQICVLSHLSIRGETPPACDQSTATNTRWRLQYDVYQYFLPENDLSERSLFSAIQAVADIQGMMANGKWVRLKEHPYSLWEICPMLIL